LVIEVFFIMEMIFEILKSEKCEGMVVSRRWFGRVSLCPIAWFLDNYRLLRGSCVG